MFETLERPYKECGASETVARIQGILRHYDLLPTETAVTSPFPEVFSMSLGLDAAKGGFRAYGKGRTIDYCKASAYAEFIERLQNGLYATYSRTMLSRLREELGFFYDPFERFLPKEEFQQLPEPILSDLVRWTGINREDFVSSYFKQIDEHLMPGVVAVPFWCSQSGEQEYIPLNLLLMAVGSNGMAAGNTLDEAIYQAICELMERWGAAQVFYRRLTPPSVPESYLRRFPQEYEIVRSIERTGRFKVVVKDFSAGMRIPAIGLMIQNTEKQTYRLNVGCDTSFQVALSRCLTEVFQGIPNDDAIDLSLQKIPTEELDCFVRDDEGALNVRQAIFAQFTRDNTGAFPLSLFAETASYAFDPDVFQTRTSYEAEVARLIGVFHRHERPVYIRPVSYLGFPSVFVYIPEVSAMGRKNAPAIRQHAIFDLVAWDRVEGWVCNIRDLAPEETEALASMLKMLPMQASITDLLNLKLKPDSVWSQVNVAFVLALLWYRVGRYDEASSAFQAFLETRPDKNDYYRAVEQYLRLRSDGVSAEEAEAELIRGFPEGDIAQEVIKDLSDPQDVFRHLRLPECPDCGSCSIAEDCLTRTSLSIARALYSAMKVYRPEPPFPSRLPLSQPGEAGAKT